MLYMMVIGNVLLFMLLAPLSEGIIRRVTARIQSRCGPPLLQPYFDLFKLLGKQNIDSSGLWPFRLAPILALASMLTVVAIVPVAGKATALTAHADLISLVYLLTLSGVAVLLGAFSSRNPYALMGASREMITMIMVEPILATLLLMGALKHRSLELATVLYGASPSLSWSLALMAVVSVLALQAFVARQPFDIAEAEIEILGGPFVEYSGPNLGLFRYALMIKQMFYAYLLVAIFVPLVSTQLWVANLLVQLAAMAVVFVLVGVLGSTNPRFRIDQALRYYAVLLVMSFGAIGLSLNGY